MNFYKEHKIKNVIIIIIIYFCHLGLVFFFFFYYLMTVNKSNWYYIIYSENCPNQLYRIMKRGCEKKKKNKKETHMWVKLKGWFCPLFGPRKKRKKKKRPKGKVTLRVVTQTYSLVNLIDRVHRVLVRSSFSWLQVVQISSTKLLVKKKVDKNFVHVVYPTNFPPAFFFFILLFLPFV